MPSRRAHKKSRFGCSHCKIRKVKCDEVRPSCSSCTRGGITCVYLPGGPSTSTLRAVSAAASSCSISNSPSPNPTNQSAFDMLDLTLMNQFTAETCFSIFAGQRQQKLWQRDIPLQARSYPLLMHGLLSVAALHLAFVEPNNLSMYRIRALYHHDIGVRSFNHLLKNVSAEESHILFAFALMLVIWVYASPAVGKEILGLDDVLTLLDLARGCHTVFRLHMHSIMDTPISALIEMHRELEIPYAELSPSVKQVFQALRLKAIDSTQLSAIEELERLIQKAVVRHDDAKIAAAWPAIVGDSFWLRLRSHEPFAVLIFAHYAMLLQHYENRWWMMAGWSERILKAAESALSDTDKHLLDWDNCLEYIRAHGKEVAS
ncbi:hypothetical protein BGZ60DRAFT_533126 [Tricladium varicosporioides]|nr:hypothetical protein BGZ60DRAFT_533126 [Hymenoscyphus varicosporioides]